MIDKSQLKIHFYIRLLFCIFAVLLTYFYPISDDPFKNYIFELFILFFILYNTISPYSISNHLEEMKPQINGYFYNFIKFTTITDISVVYLLLALFSFDYKNIFILALFLFIIITDMFYYYLMNKYLRDEIVKELNNTYLYEVEEKRQQNDENYNENADGKTDSEEKGEIITIDKKTLKTRYLLKSVITFIGIMIFIVPTKELHQIGRFYMFIYVFSQLVDLLVKHSLFGLNLNNLDSKIKASIDFYTTVGATIAWAIFRTMVFAKITFINYFLLLLIVSIFAYDNLEYYFISKTETENTVYE